MLKARQRLCIFLIQDHVSKIFADITLADIYQKGQAYLLLALRLLNGSLRSLDRIFRPRPLTHPVHPSRKKSPFLRWLKR